MQKYLIIGIFISILLGYIGWLKYDNSKLESIIHSERAKNQALDKSLQYQKSLVKIQEEKTIQLLEKIKELENAPIKTDSKIVKVENCQVTISDVDTNPETAKGIPLFLGNVGK